MVVYQDQRGRRQFQRALDHFARIDRRVVDGADLLQFVGDELVALVEEQHAELLARIKTRCKIKMIMAKKFFSL